MAPLEMIAEWRKGCSCAGPAYDKMMGLVEGTTQPEECHSCTVGLIYALEEKLKTTTTLTVERELLERVTLPWNHGDGLRHNSRTAALDELRAMLVQPQQEDTEHGLPR